MPSNRLWVATRKGLLGWQRDDTGVWRPNAAPPFLGDPVSQILHDPRDGALYAALNLGHFGCKLHRSDDGGSHWQELAAPAYPAKPDGDDDPVPWDLKLIWSLAAGGPVARSVRQACEAAAAAARRAPAHAVPVLRSP